MAECVLLQTAEAFKPQMCSTAKSDNLLADLRELPLIVRKGHDNDADVPDGEITCIDGVEHLVRALNPSDILLLRPRVIGLCRACRGASDRFGKRIAQRYGVARVVGDTSDRLKTADQRNKPAVADLRWILGNTMAASESAADLQPIAAEGVTAAGGDLVQKLRSRIFGQLCADRPFLSLQDGNILLILLFGNKKV